MITVSVLIIAKNAEKTLPLCLERFFAQDYDFSKVEVLLIDGGSTDKTLEIAKSFGVTIVDGGYPDNQEPRRYVGLIRAKNEIVLYLDSDNLAPTNHWLKDMLEPFQDPEIMASFSQWYGVEEGMSKVNQYYAMIGGNDPVVYYLGKNDRVPYLQDSLPRGAKLLEDCGRFYKVGFSAEKLPVLGCNGFFIRREFLTSLNLESPESFFHIDVHVDLFRKYPKACYAVVKTTVLHIAEHSLLAGVKKRFSYKKMHHDRFSGLRRYKVFDSSSPRDVVVLVWTIFCAITFVEPILQGLRGFLRTKNNAWLLHPAAVVLMVGAYAISFLMPEALRGR